jgi:DNA-binding transcriptional MerR regulator
MVLRLPVASETAADSADDDSRLVRVGDLAQRTNKTVRALHLYEELGLLKPSERSKGGYRLYGHDALVRVRWISKLQELGFSLPDIKDILRDSEASGSATGAMQRLKELYVEKLVDTRRQLERLATLKAELEHSIAYLDTCDVCDPERLINACPRCDMHQCGAPELVAGLHSRPEQ